MKFLIVDLFPTVLNTGTTRKPSNNIKNIIPLTYQDTFNISKFAVTFLTILGATEILCSFRLVLEETTCKEIPESSRSEFLQKFSANNFALSNAEDNTSWPLNRGGIADLPLLRRLLAFLEIHQSQVSKILVSKKINISKRAGL